jgi:hypothetical protein
MLELKRCAIVDWPSMHVPAPGGPWYSQTLIGYEDTDNYYQVHIQTLFYRVAPKTSSIWSDWLIFDSSKVLFHGYAEPCK